MKLALMERGVTFPTSACGVRPSQCTVPVGQSEQTALVGRRDFVETMHLREAGHRGPT